MDSWFDRKRAAATRAKHPGARTNVVKLPEQRRDLSCSPWRALQMTASCIATESDCVNVVRIFQCGCAHATDRATYLVALNSYGVSRGLRCLVAILAYVLTSLADRAVGRRYRCGIQCGGSLVRIEPFSTSRQTTQSVAEAGDGGFKVTPVGVAADIPGVADPAAGFDRAVACARIRHGQLNAVAGRDIGNPCFRHD